MQFKTEIINGKRRVVINNKASGEKNVEKVKKALLVIMPEYEFKKI